MKSLRRAIRFWMIASIVAIAIAFVTPLNHSITIAQEPMFRDLITGVAIDDQLDPQARAILEAAAQSGGLPAEFDAKRRAFDALFADLGGTPETIHQIEDASVPGPNGDIPIRIYRPKADKLPVIIYTHGGGFEKGSLDSHDRALRLLANRSGCTFVSVAYRLTPEHKFPTQTDDAFAVLNWVYDNADTLNVDGDRLAVAGDSVGGNLAAVNAIRARDAGRVQVRYQALFYPVTDVTLSSDSWRSFAEGPWLTRDYEMNALNNQYLPAGHDPKDPLVSPLYANVQDLPPAFVADAQFDGYRDEGQAYAGKLKDAGIPVIAKVYPGVIHDFLLMTGKLDVSMTLVEDAASALREIFNTTSAA
ncbi:alpha/beta hydrolase [Oscillatoria sp. FACHB-1407]|uniref:alpha/beta hydrolase n=1 Tax=Oscillatoria sp. FACHB-1407 TaxID=2692847 RepID=UPI0016832BBF|nr:alpha/beta hydrolase [Oscillatoria sp. FACHB-1407]MBD2465869.1 alpha/beta hydrolase [Oscillatoria sp. FACHB-1407]